MIFGTQYLRGDTPYDTDWARDLENIEKQGFNTIRAFIVWSHLEISDGVINFDYLDRFLDAVEKTGLGVGMLFHLPAAPAWLSKRHPEYWHVDASGTAWEPSSRSNTPSGGWPGLCGDNDRVREYQERFITSVVCHLSKRKCIAFWEPVNEPHQPPNWTRNEGIYCYCKATRSKFRDWLKNKYSSLENLSRAWGKPHTDWEDVDPPTFRMGYTDLVDFRMFTIENVAHEVKIRTELIKKYDGRPVMAHSFGGSCVTANIGQMAFDDWKNADYVDKWGCSGFPFDHRSSVLVGLSIDVTRNAANGKEYWQSELHSGDRGIGLQRSGRISPDQLELLTWESIRHGAKGLLYWQYRKERQGHEIGGYGLTDYDGGPTQNLLRAGSICRLIESNHDLFDDSDVIPAETAILFSPRSYLADWCNGWAMDNNCRFSSDSLCGYYRMFWEENIPVDILHEERLPELGRYKLIILTQPSALHPCAAEKIKEYVKKGGNIFSDPCFCMFDNDYQLTERMPGAGFDEVFGCSETDIASTKTRRADIVYKGKDVHITDTRFCEYFDTKEAQQTAIYSEDNKTAIAVNIFGKGKAMISGLNLGLDYAPNKNLHDIDTRNEASKSNAASKEIVMDFAFSCGIGKDFESEHANISISCLKNREKDDVIIIINNNDNTLDTRISSKYDYIKFIDLKNKEQIYPENGNIKVLLSGLGTRVLRAVKK